MGCLSVTAKRVGGMILESSRIGEGITVKTSRIGGITVTCGLVCSINTSHYLRVEPKTVWVSPDMIREILINSNTNWIID